VARFSCPRSTPSTPSEPTSSGSAT
jgi:hypothetical protein